MKVIDLLNKIANGEETPEKIRVLGNEFEYDNYDLKYRNIKKDRNNLLEHIGFYKGLVLNDEAEIIEDTPKEYINVSEEQVLFNNLSYEDQQFILKQMRMLQPCKLKNNGE